MYIKKNENRISEHFKINVKYTSLFNILYSTITCLFEGMLENIIDKIFRK